MHRLSILLLCHAGRDEFEQVTTATAAWGDVTVFSDARSAALALANDQMMPDLIAIAQAFPGQFSHEAIDELRRLAPLARIVSVLGSWCEGEMRTGSPWPGVVRTYWHQWSARCHHELPRLAQGRRCSWTLPPTATEEERLLTVADNVWPPHQGLAVLRTPSYEMADWLTATCRSIGYATVWQRSRSDVRISGASFALFDGADLSSTECEDLRTLAAAIRPAPVIALLGFPRIDDQRRARQAGAAAVLSKPLLIDDLFWAITAAIPSIAKNARCATADPPPRPK